MKDVQQQARVAVMIDCDNVPPDIIDFVMPIATQAGRVTIRRGYGNQATLSGTWSQTLAREVFTPCLQFQHASKKNTSDIALALEALEALLDGRADTFVLVTSDSDFICLCQKLRERGASIYVVGDMKTPKPLRKICDQFFEATPKEPKQATEASVTTTTGSRPKTCPQFFLNEVIKLAASSANGRVQLDALGQHLRKSHPGFCTSKYGHARLSTMVNGYDRLKLHKQGSGSWVSLVSPTRVQESACTA